MDTKDRLDQKVAFITGGSTGIGAASARLLAQNGAKVAILARHRDDLEKTAQQIEADGGDVLILQGDVSNPEDMQNAVQRIEDEWGRLDVVFANAGINGTWAPLTELTPEDWDKTLSVNLKGTFLTVKYAVPLLKRQGGSVIITSSVNGTRVFSNTGATAYSCSKAGQVAFAKMTALELAEDKIRVNVICPGAIETEIEESTERKDLEEAGKKAEFPEGAIPLTGGAPGSADQVADLVLFLASDRASHISGTEIWIDGAESLLQG